MTRISASTALLSGLVDYAGLFPPASLGLAEAVTAYASYVQRIDRGLLARFILPADRLSELEALLEPFDASAPLRLSLLAPAAASMERAVSDAAAQGDALAARRQGAIRCETFETRPAEGGFDDTARLGHDLDGASRAAGTRPVYVEFPFTRKPEASLDRLDRLAAAREAGASNLAAKIRCGGDHPEDYPSPLLLASFLDRCARLAVPFKATAGLHHPMRSYREPERVWMHGFINVFVAAAVAATGTATVEELVPILEETSPDAFTIGSGSVGWGRHRILPADVLRVRQSFAHAYGSCSFDEPTDDLRALGWLDPDGLSPA